jgi:hypothetical protein
MGWGESLVAFGVGSAITIVGVWGFGKLALNLVRQVRRGYARAPVKEVVPDPDGVYRPYTPIQNRGGLAEPVARLIGHGDTFDFRTAQRCTFRRVRMSMLNEIDQCLAQAGNNDKSKPISPSNDLGADDDEEELNARCDLMLSFEENCFICPRFGISALVNPTDMEATMGEINRGVRDYIRDSAAAAQLTNLLVSEGLRLMGANARHALENRLTLSDRTLREFLVDWIVGAKKGRMLSAVLASEVMMSMWVYAGLYFSRFRNSPQAQEAVYKRLTATYSPFVSHDGLSEAADLVSSLVCESRKAF